MSAIRSLLAATDFSADADRATRRAARLAVELGARLELLHVVSAPALADLRGLVPDMGDAEARVVAEANRMMEAIAARLHPAAARVQVGDIPGAILEAAGAHDMLVLGARGASALRDALLGTTADRLLLAARRPMLVVRREPDAAYRRVVVSCEYAPPARRALELALRVAPGARITLLHAFEADFEGPLWRASVPREQIERLRGEAEARTRAWLSGLLKGLDGASAVDVAAEFGNPRRAILDMLESQGADLVVMGKQGRSKAREMFLGSVTRQVLADSKCDVLVVAPGPAP
jgi:nucleotide-binding universal stress UspA family protein